MIFQTYSSSGAASSQRPPLPPPPGQHSHLLRAGQTLPLQDHLGGLPRRVEHSQQRGRGAGGHPPLLHRPLAPHSPQLVTLQSPGPGWRGGPARGQVSSRSPSTDQSGQLRYGTDGETACSFPTLCISHFDPSISRCGMYWREIFFTPLTIPILG